MFVERVGVASFGEEALLGGVAVAAVRIDRRSARALNSLPVQGWLEWDRETLHSASLAVQRIVPHDSLLLRARRINEASRRPAGLHGLLTWAHCRAAGPLLELYPGCEALVVAPRGEQPMSLRSRVPRGESLAIVQPSDGFADISIEAASLLARAAYLEDLRQMSRIMDMDLSAPAVEEAARLLRDRGEAHLAGMVKLHHPEMKRLLSGTAPQVQGEPSS